MLRLIPILERRASREESPFRAQLLREDAARMRKLVELACGAPGPGEFKAEGARVGWTQGDARTHELAPELERLLELVYRAEAGGEAGLDEAVEAAWAELHQARMERLLGCLSPPVPRPAD